MRRNPHLRKTPIEAFNSGSVSAMRRPHILGRIPLTLVVPHDPVAYLHHTVRGRGPLVSSAADEGAAGRASRQDAKVEPPPRLLGTFRQPVEGELQ
jgi:hypothetical protein